MIVPILSAKRAMLSRVCIPATHSTYSLKIPHISSIKMIDAQNKMYQQRYSNTIDKKKI